MNLQTLPRDVSFVARAENGFSVIETSKTLILDWDILKAEAETTMGGTEQTETSLVEVPALTEDNAESGCCTISCTQEAIERLEAQCEKNTAPLWAVYETGHGVRAFRLDRDFPTTDPALKLLTLLLEPDQKYIDSSVARSRWAARVSHKQGRPDEQIRFLQWIGSGQTQPHHWEVLKCHHELLLEHRLTETPFSELEAALEVHLRSPCEDYSEFWA